VFWLFAFRLRVGFCVRIQKDPEEWELFKPSDYSCLLDRALSDSGFVSTIATEGHVWRLVGIAQMQIKMDLESPLAQVATGVIMA
jgi:hypothetical protein